MSKFGPTTARLLFLLGFAYVALWIWAKPSYEIIAQWRLPKDEPSSQEQFYLSIVEDTRDFSTLAPGRKYAVFIGRSSAIDYGHLANFPYDPSTYTNGSVDQHLQECEIVTTTGGITLITPPGHTLFIPASEYTGGR